MNRSGIFRAFLSVVSASVTAAAVIGAAPARALTVNLPFDGTCSWTPSTQTLTCVANDSPPPTPGVPSCTLAASPNSLPAGGGSVSLTATCTNSPTSYQWTGTGLTSATTTTNSNSASIQASASFSVTASNQAGAGQAASRSVQVGALLGGLSCPGFTKTLFVEWDWGTTLSKLDTVQIQNGLGTNGILVVPFKPTGPSDNASSLISATGFPAPNMQNELRLAISTEPCDLNPPAPAAVTGPSPTVFYAVGASPVSNITGKPTKAALTPGVQYYINVAGRSSVNASNPAGSQSCVPGGLQYPNCEVRLSVQKPSGH